VSAGARGFVSSRRGGGLDRACATRAALGSPPPDADVAAFAPRSRRCHPAACAVLAGRGAVALSGLSLLSVASGSCSWCVGSLGAYVAHLPPRGSAAHGDGVQFPRPSPGRSERSVLLLGGRAAATATVLPLSPHRLLVGGLSHPPSPAPAGRGAMVLLAAAPPPGPIPGMDVTTVGGAALVAFLVVAVFSFTLLRGLGAMPLGVGDGVGLGGGGARGSRRAKEEGGGPARPGGDWGRGGPRRWRGVRHGRPPAVGGACLGPLGAAPHGAAEHRGVGRSAGGVGAARGARGGRPWGRCIFEGGDPPRGQCPRPLPRTHRRRGLSWRGVRRGRGALLGASPRMGARGVPIVRGRPQLAGSSGGLRSPSSRDFVEDVTGADGAYARLCARPMRRCEANSPPATTRTSGSPV